MPLGTSPPHTLDKGDYYYSLPSPRRRPPPVPPADLIPSIGRQTCLSTCPAGANKNRQQEGLLGLFFQFTRWAAQESKTSRQAPRSLCSCRACARVFAPLVLVFGRGVWGQAFIEKLSIVDSCSQVEAGDLRDASWPAGRVDESGIKWIDRSFHLRLTHPFSWELWAAASFVHLTCFPIPSTLPVLSKSKSGFKVRV